MTSQLLSIIFPEGNPNGIRKIEIPHTSVRCFIVPRGSLSKLQDEKLLQKPSFYILTGEGEEVSRPRAYIGESENGLDRLLRHDATKEFWNTAYVFVGDDLDKASVKYLEHIAVQRAKAANRFEIKNVTEPAENTLSGFQRIACEQYLIHLEFIISFLGLSLFQSAPKNNSETKFYQFKTDGANAKGALLESGEFIVYKGSTSRIRETDAFASHKYAPVLRQKLVAEGVLKETDDTSYEFTVDYIFSSPSAAGNTVAGRSTDGWIVWVDEDGKSLDENVRK